MARRRHPEETELYEGNGEVVSYGSNPRDSWHTEAGVTPLPGKRPRGRDENLQARDAFDRRLEEERNRRRNGGYARRQFYDGLGEDENDYDYEDRIRSTGRKNTPHRGLWLTVICLCVLLLMGMGLLILPQITGVRYRFIPNLAFVNNSVLKLDEETKADFDANRDYLFSDRIYRGVMIDGIDVGGMTSVEAIAAIEAAQEAVRDSFALSVTVGNRNWIIDQDQVPITRNTAEMVEKALLLGRNQSDPDTRYGKTPFQERVDKASEMISFPIYLETGKTFDHEALKAECSSITAFVNREPVNSMVTAFDFGTQTFSFSDDVPGAFLSTDEVFERLAACLENEDYHASVVFVPEKRLADITKTELMNGFRKISTYTTKTTSNKNRNTNIRLSAEAINGTTVLPGETFSFNGTTGERTAEKGYKPAAAISGGQSRDEIGGGVCQTSSTLFNAVARANLEIVSRSPHAWPSSYVEKGMDATVNWPGLDFKFKNSSDQPIFIVAAYAGQKVTVDIYGMSLGNDVTIDLESETTEVIPQPEGTNYVLNSELKPGESKTTVTGRKGYKVDTYRVWYQAGKEVKRELMCHSTYKAYQETIEYNPR